MKKVLILLIILHSSILSGAQVQQERLVGEVNATFSSYTSFSVTVGKEFRYNKWFFGPRIDLVNPIGLLTYRTKDGEMTMSSQVRVYLSRIEWQGWDNVRIGASPFWMLGPIPRNGYYLTPSSVWVNYKLSEKRRIEATVTNNTDILIQLSFRQEL